MKTVILRGRPGITVFYINRRHRNMAIDKVKEYFKAYGMEDRILEFPVSSATVELAAEALGCEPCRIAKTLSFMVRIFCFKTSAFTSAAGSSAKSVFSML